MAAANSSAPGAKASKAFARDLPMMMYGFGDDPFPLSETIKLVEEFARDYVGRLISRGFAVWVGFGIGFKTLVFQCWQAGARDYRLHSVKELEQLKQADLHGSCAFCGEKRPRQV